MIKDCAALAFSVILTLFGLVQAVSCMEQGNEQGGLIAILMMLAGCAATIAVIIHRVGLTKD